MRVSHRQGCYWRLKKMHWMWAENAHANFTAKIITQPTLLQHENWSGDGHKMVFIQLALTLLKVPSRITFKMRSKKRSYGRGGNMDGTLIQWDIANNFKKMPNLSQRIWPKGNTTFLFQSLLDQCPTCRGTLNVTNWRQCINYSHYTCQKYGLICVSVSWWWKCWCWFHVIDLHMMSTK